MTSNILAEKIMTLTYSKAIVRNIRNDRALVPRDAFFAISVDEMKKIGLLPSSMPKKVPPTGRA
jgi:hypothetical protein